MLTIDSDRVKNVAVIVARNSRNASRWHTEVRTALGTRVHDMMYKDVDNSLTDRARHIVLSF